MKYDTQTFLPPFIRTLKVAAAKTANAIFISMLPSVLPVVRPDGTAENEPARLTGLRTYSFRITDERLAKLVDAGKMKANLHWHVRDHHTVGQSHPAAYIHFQRTTRNSRERKAA